MNKIQKLKCAYYLLCSRSASYLHPLLNQKKLSSKLIYFWTISLLYTQQKFAYKKALV